MPNLNQTATVAALSKIELKSAIDSLISILSEKESYVVKRRFAINLDEKQTLDEIGKHFGITRERVRQIEFNALKKLSRSAQNSELNNLSEFAKALLENEGGVMSDNSLKTLISSILPNLGNEKLNQLHLALCIDSDIEFYSNTISLNPYWCVNGDQNIKLKKIIEKSLAFLKKQKAVANAEVMAQKINTALKLELSGKELQRILELSKEVKMTSTGVGLHSWRHINPRTLKDKILFVLNKDPKPMHFRKITQIIIEQNFDSKKINSQAVHNELIRNENFVLIGRGIYAMKAWGYSSGTVADVITEILSDGTPRTRDEITKEVMKKRQVKAITIYLNLKNKQLFSRIGRDKYGIVEKN